MRRIAKGSRIATSSLQTFWSPRQGIKLVDFGLAKVGNAPLKDGEETLTQALTQQGQILGTLQYMLPEQLQGKEVDARSDLFAFGCVLYEMLSGKRAFDADSPASLIAAVLERQPAPLNLAPPLDRLIRKCLAKDPDERFQTARDLKYNLELAIEQPPPVAPAPKRRWWIGVLCGLAAVIVLAFLLIQPRVEDTLGGLRFTPIAVEAASQSAPAFSPDGKSIAYYKAGPPDKIMVRQLDRDVAVELADGRAPFWSPDSRFIYYRRAIENLAAGGEIWKVSVTGGVPELVVKGATFGVFTPDGASLLVSRSGRIQVSSPPGAEPKDPPKSVQFPDGIIPFLFAPDGSKWLGFGKGKSWIFTYPQGKTRELPAGVNPNAWFPDNRRMLFIIRSEIGVSDELAVFDSETLETRTIFRSPARIAQAAVAPDGKRIVFGMGVVDWNIQEFTTDGKLTRDLVATSLSDGAPAWSPRGDRLAYISESSGTQDVWVRDNDGRNRARVLKNRRGSRLHFAPDGPAYRRGP